MPDREAVEAGEPVEDGDAGEQEQLDQDEVGAEQPAQPCDLGERPGGPVAVGRAGRGGPERDDDPRVGQREQGEEAAGDPPPVRAHAWSVVGPRRGVNTAVSGLRLSGAGERQRRH